MKERLTGAIILVVVIVLLVPELLSGPSRPTPQALPALATSSEEAPLRSYTINLADDARTAGAGTASTPAQASGPAQPTPITESTPNPTQPNAVTDDGQSDAPPQTSAAALPTGDSLAGSPLGISSLAARSRSVAANPPSENPAPPPQYSPPQNGAPPQHSPPPAQPPQRSMTPEKPSPAQQHYAAAERQPVEHERSESSGASGGWVVQLGVFSVQANAERLAQELKTQGFHALVSQMGGAGRPMWRVRAGPVAEHAAAEQLSARLRAAGHAGSVVPK